MRVINKGMLDARRLSRRENTRSIYTNLDGSMLPKLKPPATVATAAVVALALV